MRNTILSSVIRFGIKLPLVGSCLMGASIAGIIAAIALSPGHILAQDILNDPVVKLLSGYHFTATNSELEKAAGGRTQLVNTLLNLRHLEQPPFVGIRAAKVLMSMTGEQRVAEALEKDVGEYLGLARVIVTNLDSVPDSAVRTRLAKAAISRASREDKFKPFAKTIMQSRHPELAKLAADSLK